jgi:hypothetical protein
MNEDNHRYRVYDEDEESIESANDAHEEFSTPIEKIPQIKAEEERHDKNKNSNYSNEEDKNSNDDDSEDNSIPGLQDRDVEDSSDDDDGYDANMRKTDNIRDYKSNEHRSMFGRYTTEYNGNNSDSDSDDDSYGPLRCRQQQQLDNAEESTIPKLICRKDNDDSSNDDDDDNVEYSMKDPTDIHNIDHELSDENITANTTTPFHDDYNEDALYFQPSDDENEGDNIRSEENEPAPAEHFFLIDLDEIEAESIGGRIDIPKLPGMIRISGCNPNGIQAEQLKSHLQHSLDLGIDIQCYSEVNTDFMKIDQRQKYYEYTKSMNNQS